MYQNIYFDKKSEVCYLWDDKLGMKSFPVTKYAYRKKENGSYKSMYGDPLEKVLDFNPRDPNVFEGDVPIETFVLRDAYEDSDESSKGHKVLIFDIEVSMEGGKPDVATGNKEITAISFYDRVSDKYHALILDKDKQVADQDRGNTFIRSYSTEESLLETFLNKWEEIQPTIVSGWNSSSQLNPDGGFDIPYLFNRLKVVLGEKSVNRLSPIGVCFYNKFKKSVVIAGVSCLDYMDLYKKFIGKNRPTYRLAYIGPLEVGISKLEYKGSLTTLYKEDINKYVEYNLNDVIIVKALDDKFKYIELAREICHLGHVPYEWFHMSSRYLEGTILMYLRRNKLIAPNKPSQNLSVEDEIEKLANKDEDEDETFSGAYVKEPIPGRYDWLYDLDLSSEYPNIIISLNISPETKVGKVQSVELSEQGLKYRTEKLKNQYEELDDKEKRKITKKDFVESKINDFDSDCFAQNIITSYTLGGVKYEPNNFIDLLKSENLSIASNGVIYVQSQKGVIPTLLSSWFAQRKEMRKLCKKYHDEKNKELEEYYDRKQYNYKILLNSMYGTLGLPVFRFYDVDNAAAVTYTGVTVIQTTGKLINQYYRNITKTNDDYLIYSDTDSCFVSAVPIVKVRNPEMDLTAVETNTEMVSSILGIASEVQGFINKAYDVMAKRMFNSDKHTFEIKQEIIATTGVWLAKKRYALWRINENGKYISDASKKLEVKGIDIVRTSFPIKFRSFLEEVLRLILAKEPKSLIDEKILNFRASLKSFDVMDLAKNTSVNFWSGDGETNYDPKNREPFTMLKGTTAQAKAALYYNDLLKHFKLLRSVETIHSSTKIKWVYLKDNPYNIECLAFKADGTDPDKVMDIINTYVDRRGLYDKELKKKLVNFYEILNWEFPVSGEKKALEFFS